MRYAFYRLFFSFSFCVSGLWAVEFYIYVPKTKWGRENKPLYEAHLAQAISVAEKDVFGWREYYFNNACLAGSFFAVPLMVVPWVLRFSFNLTAPYAVLQPFLNYENCFVYTGVGAGMFLFFRCCLYRLPEDQKRFLAEKEKEIDKDILDQFQDGEEKNADKKI